MEKTTIHNFEDLMNWLTDMDWGWWPFLFLRPEKTKDITTALVAKLTLFYGLPFGVILAIFMFNWIIIPYIMVLFFVVYRLTFAVFWNRRARRLRSLANGEPT